MDEDIEITMEETEEAEPAPEEAQLPVNFITFGELARDDVRVYIHRRVYQELEKYAASDTSRELGTILIGDYREEQGSLHVIISDYIPARYTDASASTLTFTHETWEDVHREHDEKYPDKRIIGWQHTHPNYGIFLSNYDLFIQENFFDLPFQIAYVIDPIQKLRGFFQWKDGKVTKLGGYAVYDEVGRPIELEAEKTRAAKGVKSEEARGGGSILTALMVLLFAALLGCTALLYFRYRAQRKAQQQLESRLTQQEERIASQEREIAALEAQTGTVRPTEPSDPAQPTDPGEDPEGEALRQEVQAQAEEIKALQTEIQALREKLAELEEKPAESGPHFIRHTVQAGESLYSICAQHGLDYAATQHIILAINGIQDPNYIYVGQELMLPAWE